MKRYLGQLIEDMRKAAQLIRPPHKLWEESEADPFDEGELEDMSYIEQFVEGEVQPVSVITGIDEDAFPPSDKLTRQQQEQLACEMEKLLDHFHFTLDFPQNYPMYLRYTFFRNFWKEEHVPLSFGTTHIELCDFDENNCPFPGYCNSCEEYRLECEKGEKTSGESVNPFDLLPTQQQLDEWWIHQQRLKQKNAQEDDHDEDNDLTDEYDNEDLPF